MGAIMEILETIFGLFLMTFMFLLSYVGYHMAKEKDEGKQLPMFWEEGGFFRKKERPVYDKHKMAKTRDGDNT
jgi:hypothetical protein